VSIRALPFGAATTLIIRAYRRTPGACPASRLCHYLQTLGIYLSTRMRSTKRRRTTHNSQQGVGAGTDMRAASTHRALSQHLARTAAREPRVRSGEELVNNKNAAVRRCRGRM